MDVLEFIYNEETISFDPSGNENMMVNATQMAKAFGKRVDVFLKADKTQEYIDALLESLNEEGEFTPNGGNSTPLTKDDILQTRGQNGTWMHRFLALEFAGWMNARFKVWVWKTVNKILLGHFRQVKTATYEKLAAERAAEAKRKELLSKNPDFVEFLELEGKVSKCEKRRQKAMKASMAQFKIDFHNS